MSATNLLDADAWNAISMGAVLASRDTLLRGKPSLKKSGVVTAAQYGYNKLLASTLEAYLAKFTGEGMYSSILANTLGLAGILAAADAVGLVSKKSDSINGDGEKGALPDVKVGGKMVGRLLKSSTRALELVLEQKLAVYALNMIPAVNAMLPAGLAGQNPADPQPAKVAC